MSGGRFDYIQYQIYNIADTIQTIIDKNGAKKTEEELKDEDYRGADWYIKYPEDLYHYKYPPEVIEKFKEGVVILKEAFVYAHRID